MPKKHFKNIFLPLARFFILARVLVFLASRDKKYIFPKGIFGTGKFTFWRGKNLLRVEKCNSWVNARHFSSFGMTKKKFCALARSFWPSGCFWDFFGLQKAFGLLQAKKIPKTGLRPKWPCRSTKFFFVLPHDDIVVHFSMKHYIFLAAASTIMCLK